MNEGTNLMRIRLQLCLVSQVPGGFCLSLEQRCSAAVNLCQVHLVTSLQLCDLCSEYVQLPLAVCKLCLECVPLPSQPLCCVFCSFLQGMPSFSQTGAEAIAT